MQDLLTALTAAGIVAVVFGASLVWLRVQRYQAEQRTLRHYRATRNIPLPPDASSARRPAA